MEEAEALCDRLGIFVDGRLQCIADAKEVDCFLTVLFFHSKDHCRSSSATKIKARNAVYFLYSSAHSIILDVVDRHYTSSSLVLIIIIHNIIGHPVILLPNGFC